MGLTIQAKSINLNPSSPTLEIGGDTCDLPAPFNFHIKGLGPDWVTFGWDLINPNIQHRIRLYRASDNVLLSTTIVPAGNFEATIPIPTNTSIYGVANAICQNGVNSPNNSTSPNATGVILDLIVSGFQGSSNDPACSFSGTSSCPFNNTGYSTFRIKYGESYSEKFDIERDIDTENLRFFARPEDGNSTDNGEFNFYCMPDVAPDCSAPYVVINFRFKNQDIPAARITAGQNTQTIFELYGTTFSYNNVPFVIQRLTPYSNQGRQAPIQTHIGIKERGKEDLSISGIVSPNPFDQELSISFDKPQMEKTTIQLFSSEGRLALQETIPANQSSHTLSTAHLSPGFYFLRVEVDGEVQTFKVIKSAQ
ncbi:MAG: T9SS type A sorting domain-containing protein [Saprospiraceae bacterium]|nr:T9SS type A sorting domain-containing protein [Saprospiraceae bacterium]